MRDSAPGPEWTSLIFDGVIFAVALLGANALFHWNLSWTVLAALTVLTGTGRFLLRRKSLQEWAAWATKLPGATQAMWEQVSPWMPPLVDAYLLGAAVWMAGHLTARGWGWAIPLEAALTAGVIAAVCGFLPAFGRLAAAIATAVALGLLNRVWPQPLSGIGTVYLAAVAALGGYLMREAVRRSEVPAAEAGREHLRLLAIVAVAVGVFAPLITPELVGGLDARWYGYTVTDAISQARAGIFPVLVGQGEYMFNGAVHPFRTAPYHGYLAIVLDLATCHRLAPLAIEHLTLVATALQAGLLSYWALAALTAGRRTAAALLAMIFITAPLLAAYVYGQEMYMTSMAFGFLPLVLYANLRLLKRDQLASFLLLAGALSAIWMCHAPVAFWTTLATLGMQGLRLLTWDWNFGAWRRAALAGAAFLALSAYYFASISELDSSKTQGTALLLVAGVVLVPGFMGLVRFVATRSLPWLGVGIGAAGILLFLDFIRGVYLATALAAAAALRLLPAKSGPRFGVLAGTLLSGLVGIGLAAAFPTGRYPRGLLATFAAAMDAIRHNFPGVVLPVSPTAVALSDLQLGWSCWLLLGALAVAAWRIRAREWQVLALVAGAFALLALPVPGLTPALLSLIPGPVYGVSMVLLGLRFLPVFGALAVFAGGGALLRLVPDRRRGHVVLVLVVLLGWNLIEVRKFVGRGRASVSLPQTTAAYLRTENARLYSYDYDNFPLPAYVVNGVVDYHLENRLLRPDDQSVLPDPVWRMPPRLASPLTESVDKYDAHWLHLRPKLTLQPGERLALEFQFDQQEYEGSLVFRGNHGFYRDYQLPNAGDGEKSFGIAPGRPKMLAIWNSSAQPEEIELLYLRNVLKPGEGTGTFATITARAYRPEDLQVKMSGLLPYRAEVLTDRPVLLETPRVFMPGYRARVNGQPVEVRKSAEQLATIPLPAGRSVVELANFGSGRLKFALVISVGAWLVLVVAGLRAGLGRARA